MAPKRKAPAAKKAAPKKKTKAEQAAASPTEPEPAQPSRSPQTSKVCRSSFTHTSRLLPVWHDGRLPQHAARLRPHSLLSTRQTARCARTHSLTRSLSAGCAGNGQQDDCGRGLVCALRERHALQSPLTQRTTRTRAHAVQPPPIDRASR